MGLRRIVIYTGLRFGLFAVAFGLLWLVLRNQLSSWVLALLALIVSSIAALFLLRGHAEAAGEEFAGGWRTARGRLDEAKRREDDDYDDRDDGDRADAEDDVTDDDDPERPASQ